MFNLLPDKNKRDIKNEYRARRLDVVTALALGVQIIALVFLFPSFIHSYLEYQRVSDLTDPVKIDKLSSDQSEINGQILELNRKVQSLRPENGQAFVYRVVGDVLDKTDSGIKVRGIFYNKESKESFSINISGNALLRENLVTFVGLLEDMDEFLSVDLPVSDLAKSQDIDFSLEIKGNY